MTVNESFLIAYLLYIQYLQSGATILKILTGHIRPSGRSLPMPALNGDTAEDMRSQHHPTRCLWRRASLGP